MVSRLVDVYDGEMILEQATNDDYIARHLVKDVCPRTLLQGPFTIAAGLLTSSPVHAHERAFGQTYATCVDKNGI